MGNLKIDIPTFLMCGAFPCHPCRQELKCVVSFCKKKSDAQRNQVSYRWEKSMYVVSMFVFLFKFICR